MKDKSNIVRSPKQRNEPRDVPQIDTWSQSQHRETRSGRRVVNSTRTGTSDGNGARKTADIIKPAPVIRLPSSADKSFVFDRLEVPVPAENH